MVLQMAEGSIAPGIRLGQATYYPGRDACVVEVSDKIQPGNIANVVHENYHSLSAHKVCAQEGKDIEFDNTNAKTMKMGFFTLNTANERRPHVLNGLNEGTTELFTRITMRRAGLEINSESSYDNYVKNVLVLDQVLKDQPVDAMRKYEDIDPKEMADLLNRYTSNMGTLALAREMKEKIGPNALAMFDLLGGTNAEFIKFITAVQDAKEGKLQIGTITLSPEELAKYGMEPEKVLEVYPFITVAEPPKVNFEW